jgi:signal transduction histidine kinase
MLLHPPTIFVIAWLLALILGCMHLWFWAQDRQQPALAAIGVAYVNGAVGAVLVASRGELPDWTSVMLANALFSISYGLIWTAMRFFEGRRARPLLAVMGALVWLAACQVPAIYDSLPARIVVMSCVVAVYCGAAAMELLRGRVSRALPSRRPLIALLAIQAILHGVRAPLLMLSPVREQGMTLPTQSPWFAFVSLGTIIVVVGISTLLVALTREEAQQRSNATLEAARDVSDRANEEKSRFLARMSHELRTLLNSVLGMAQTLAGDPGLTAAQQDRARTLERAGRHLAAIVNDILDLGRVEAGRLELVPRPIDLRGELEDVIALVRPMASEKRIALDLLMLPPLPAAVEADPLRLRQILLNLIGNAVKFTPAGGQVRLSAMSGQAGITLAVTDTGPGVPAELRVRLFQDYERMGADAAGTEGTGLGLAITAALARAMGGRAWYAPGPDGIGSCFSVALPLPATILPAPVERPAPEPRRPSESLSILVVDDIAANRLVAEALLTQGGHRVQLVADGPAAITALEAGPLPDVVLMDIFMPGMDGYEATRRIRALPGPAARVPVLAVTAEAAPEEVRACLESGMDGHLSKPIDRQALLRAVAQVSGVRA